MNATMIQHREVSDMLNHLNTTVNNDLVKYANKYFGSSLTIKQQQELCALPIEEKQWLLNQYKEEIKFNKEPDLSHLY